MKNYPKILFLRYFTSRALLLSRRYPSRGTRTRAIRDATLLSHAIYYFFYGLIIV